MELYTFGKNPILNVIWGSLGGAFFIGWNLINSLFVIGIPAAIGGSIDTFIVRGILAPVMETIVFPLLLLYIFVKLLRGQQWYSWQFLVASIAVSLIFATFHSAFYGAFGLASASYFSAWLFMMVSCYATRLTKSVLTPLIMHLSFNWYLMIKPFIGTVGL